MRYIENFQEGEQIVAHYLCKKRETLKTKSGKNYLSLILADRTGECVARVWTLNNDIQSFEAGDFIKIEATVDVYNDQLQLNVRKIRKSGQGEFLPADYIPTVDGDIGEIYKSICGLIESVENKHLQALLQDTLINNTEVKEAFLSHSAARNMHHSYMGGLAEHSLNVAQICDFLAPRYKFVNRDLLVTAALLHDIGKIYELSPFPENDYTDQGKLIGHITMGANFASEQMGQIAGFPKDLQNLLVHCLLSHHGTLEYGSPIVPKTIEAFILSNADTLDAHTKQFEEHLAKAPANSPWAGFMRSGFNRDIRKSTP
ncbi:MAG: HD domain-containing protein [Defluviitaleaceae bacterium]|nr:HD domain-containing protein [Defluviitaleaceae bacterium]